MISVVCLNTLSIRTKKQGNLLNSFKRNQVQKKRERRNRCSTNQTPSKESNSKPKQNVWSQESDTSGWDCIHMSAVERFQYAASLQVLYEDMETYKDEVKTYKDWMIILERLEAMKSFDPLLFSKCITKRWIEIGKPLVKTMSDQEVYCVIEKLAKLQQSLQENQQQRARSTQNIDQQLLYGTFPLDLLKRLGIDDFTSWSNVFDRCTQIC
eukprot:TRINITY_DN32106_c3_g1_i1.p1 TRINITY_DN32106_c3_g1~~TRINITY_DN32106_c3_g1_i1.p1  ORF type:complete len:229 (+),score=7.16 TRINITY_DN32106_c3_g1_i1:55-687(+)